MTDQTVVVRPVVQQVTVAPTAQRVAVATGGDFVTKAALAAFEAGLGDAATLDVGTTAGTVAAGDDTRIVDAASDVEQMVVPPAAAAYAGITPAVQWYSANRTSLMRFQTHRRGQFSGVSLGLDVPSGNIEVAVLSCTRTGVNTWDLAKVATSGVIPCPTPGQPPMTFARSVYVPLVSPVTLTPGEYALGVWCDNTTARFYHGLLDSAAAAAWSLSDVSGASTTGIPRTYTGCTQGARGLVATLEGSVALRMKAVGMGDSITELQTWFSTANAATGRKYNYTNAGIGGQTTVQMVPRLSSDVLARNPDLCTVLGGSNDNSQSVPSATTIANLGSMVSAITGGGARVILGTVPPRLNTANAPLTSEQVDAYWAVNAWIRGQSSTSVQVADWSVQLSTGDGITPNLGYFMDNVHPNAAGQAVMAGVLAPLL